MLTVYGVKTHNMGFGEFQRDAEGVTFDVDNLHEYIEHVAEANPDIEFVEPTDDEFEQVEAARGATDHQDGGTIIGWRHPGGLVTLECVIADA
jgi:hypothetical protein